LSIMAKKVNPVIIGAFVAGAIILMALAVIVLSTGSMLQKKHRFLIYFRSDTNGLDEGADVRIGGVRVGKVVSMRVQTDPKTGLKIMPVVIEIFEGSVRKATAEPVDFSSDEWFMKSIEQEGLKALLKSQSLLTGKRYVDLDILPDVEGYLFEGPPVDPYPQIPSVADEIEEMKASFSQTLDKINSIDFTGISKRLVDLLDHLDAKVGELELKEASDEFVAAGKEIRLLATDARGVVKDENIKLAVSDLRDAMTSLKDITAKLDKKVDPLLTDFNTVIADVGTALDKIETASEKFSTLVDPEGALGLRMNLAVGEIGQAAKALRELSEYLKRNPNALITGKKQPGAR